MSVNWIYDRDYRLSVSTNVDHLVETVDSSKENIGVIEDNLYFFQLWKG